MNAPRNARGKRPGMRARWLEQTLKDSDGLSFQMVASPWGRSSRGVRARDVGVGENGKLLAVFRLYEWVPGGISDLVLVHGYPEADVSEAVRAFFGARFR